MFSKLRLLKNNGSEIGTDNAQVFTSDAGVGTSWRLYAITAPCKVDTAAEIE